MAHSATVRRTILVGLEYGKRSIRYISVKFQGGMPELKQAILNRFYDIAGVEDLGPDHLIIHVKREEFGEFEEIELESDIPDKSVLKAVVEEVRWIEYCFVRSI